MRGTKEIKLTLQAIRENAIIEMALEDNELNTAMKSYLCYSTYNKINGDKTTVAAIKKEVNAKKVLAEILKYKEIDILQKCVEIAQR